MQHVIDKNAKRHRAMRVLIDNKLKCVYNIYMKCPGALLGKCRSLSIQ